MKAVADAYKERSIHAFDAAYEKYKEQLDDPVVASHLEELKGKLLEQNLLRLIEPVSPARRICMTRKESPLLIFVFLSLG